MLPIVFRGHEDAGFFVHALTYTDGCRLVETLPGNMRTPSAHYACVVSVRDYWRMIKAKAEKEQCWHYSTGLEPAIVEDVKAGRAIIVFDLSNEGPDYWGAVFDELYAWIEQNSIPAGRVIWLAQNRAISNHARQQSAGRSNLVAFEYYDFFLKMVAWEFSPRESTIYQPYRNDPERAIAELLAPNAKDSVLLCLNATPRLQRILAVAALRQHGLFSRSLVSFGGFGYAKPGTTLESALEFVTANPRLNYLNSELYKLKSMGELVVDALEGTGNALISRIDPKAYARSYFSLVTESDFSSGNIDRITEKTAKAFCMGHPTIVIGNPRSINHMVQLGFHDWQSFDRSYDFFDDPAQRFAAVINEVIKQAKAIEADPLQWLEKNLESSAWNIRHAFTGAMLTRYVSLYDLPLVNRLCHLIGKSF